MYSKGVSFLNWEMFYSKNEAAWESEVAEVFVDSACIIYWYLLIWKCKKGM